MKKNHQIFLMTILVYNLFVHSCNPPPINTCNEIFVISRILVSNPYTGQPNGKITVQVTGNIADLKFKLNDQPEISLNEFNNLGPGIYKITVRHTKGCTSTREISLVEVEPCKVTKVIVESEQKDPTSQSPSSGSITASAKGGSGFMFKLDGPSPRDYQVSGSFTNLVKGTYIITARNSAGCTASLKTELVLVVNCASKVITMEAKIAHVTRCDIPANNGTITITAKTTPAQLESRPYTYSIGRSVYSPSNIFSNLAVGTYTVNVKDAAGCVKTMTVTINTAPIGSNFTAVRNMLQWRCSPCHTINKDGLVNFTDECQIVSKWDRIRDRVDNNTMPPLKGSNNAKPLSASEKQILKNWINAGHKYTN
jgi:hypothetical protein